MKTELRFGHFFLSQVSVYFLILLVTLVVYFPSVKAGFILDDYPLVVQNPLIKEPALHHRIFTADFFDTDKTSVRHSLNYYRPVTLATFALDYRLWRLNPVGYRLVNILIHSLVCFLIFKIVARIFKEEKMAFFSSLFFCVMPIHGGTVNHIVGRSDLLQAFFSLLSLHCLLRYFEKKSFGRYAASLGFFVMAFLSREAALVLPLFAALISLAWLPDRKRIVAVSLPFFALAGLYILARSYIFPIASEGVGQYFSRENAAGWFGMFFDYVPRFIFPWGLQSLAGPGLPGYVFVWCAWGMYLAMVVLLLRHPSFKKAAVFANAWILLGLLPLFVMAKLVERLGPYFSECFLYFAAVGFSVVMGSVFARWKKPSSGPAFVMLLALYAGISLYGNFSWGSEERTLRRAVFLEKSYGYLAGMQLLMKYEENIPEIEKLLGRLQNPSEKSIWLKRLGNIYRRQGNYLRAIGYFNRAVALNANNIEARNELAVSYLETGDFDAGIALLKESLGIDPQYSETYRLCGIAFYRAKNFPLAVQYLQQAVFWDPDNEESWQHLAMAYFFASQNDRYQNIIDTVGQRPGYALNFVKFAAGELYRHQEYQNAVLLVEQSLHLFPGDQAMLKVLIESYLALGKREQAERVWNENASYFRE